MKVAWTTRPFADVVNARGSGARGLPQKQWAESGQFPVVGQGEGDIEGWTDRQDLLIAPKPALVLYGGHTRRAKHVACPFVPGPNVRILTPCPELDARFLFYFLTQLPIPSKGYADHFPLVRKCEVRYPALPEQRRIVAILDAAMEGINAAKANAERNLANARETFEAALNASLDAASAKGGSRRLGDLVTRLTNGYVGPTRNIYTDDGVPYLLARHVKDNNLQFDGKTYVSDAFNKRNNKSILCEGDVLLVQSGHIGHSAVVPEEHEGHNCHAMIVISTKPGTITGEFLSLLFNSSRMRQVFWAIRSGSTVPHLTCKAVKELEIPVPPLDSQASLVSRSQSLRSESDLLCDATASKLVALDELKASLLHQAFTGQL